MQAIPLLTTATGVGRNPGDAFIRAGVQHLIERVLGPQSWVLLDWHDRSTFRRLAPVVRRCPFVVYAGTPQYSPYVRWKDWRMWTEHVFEWGLPILALGGGTLWRRFVGEVDGYVEYCLKHRGTCDVVRRRTSAFACVSVRDPYADALLDALSIQPEISQMTDSRPSRTITSRENILNEPERTPDASIHVREPAFFASSYAKASRYQADRRCRCGLLPPQD